MRRVRVSITALALAFSMCLASAVPAAAINLLRDPDMEHGLFIMAFPILRAAGLSPTRTKVLVVDDDRLNAFVVDHRAIYVTSGLVQKVTSAQMLQALIAHEAAHISNGHIARRSANLKAAQAQAGLGMALGVLAAAAGSAEAGVGLGSLSSSVAQRGFLAHTRAEEAAADRSAAAYLKFANVDPQALVDLHLLFLGQERLNISRQDEYTSSHPLTRDRVRAAEEYVSRHGFVGASDPEVDYWFARLKGKLSAFKRPAKWTRRRVEAETYPDVRHMRLAVAWHRENNMSRALRSLDQALVRGRMIPITWNCAVRS
ncbi:MAG: M48 family metalloprotease [Paracoccaceae bacterium]